MPAIYLCDVTGTGTSSRDPFRPAVPTAASYECLMIDPDAGKAIIWSSDATLAGTGITLLLQAASRAALIDLAKTTGPSAPRRATLNTWCTNHGYTPVPAQALTWAAVILFVARQVNSAADIEAVDV